MRDISHAWLGIISEKSSQLAMMICPRFPSIVYPISFEDLLEWYLFFSSCFFNEATAVFIFCGTLSSHHEIPYAFSDILSTIKFRIVFSIQYIAVYTEDIFRASCQIRGLKSVSTTRLPFSFVISPHFNTFIPSALHKDRKESWARSALKTNSLNRCSLVFCPHSNQ